MDKPLPAAEQAKVNARFLRGTLPEELGNSESVFSKPATSVLKFHGVYQQDDRDLRKQGEKKYTAMVRIGIPGGKLTASQYLTLDRLADIGDGSLRITTRQDIQYHYVPKQRLSELIRGVNESYLSTLAACGDVVRNVVCCPAPFESEQRHELQPIVQFISRSLKPKTTSYLDIWMDGEQVKDYETNPSPDLLKVEPFKVEPLYGATYLPRKFKIGFAFPGDNTTDLYSNDIGIVPRYEANRLAGFTILAGGGMGQSAGVKASHPRLADPICSIGPTQEELLEVCSAIVTIHRDYGNRTNRKLARLKYVMDDWGVEKFKAELETRVGRTLAPPPSLEWVRSVDYLGWYRQGTGTWFVGVRIIAGRVRDFDSQNRVRSGIREIVQRFQPDVGLTSQQNLYLSGISDNDRPAVSQLLREYGIAEPAQLPPVLRHAMSCPALPTCGQAITESERIMPEVVAEIQNELNQVGLSEQIIHLRTTGCPNGCARPYTAEIGIVGASVDMYTIYLGASPLGTRLGKAFAQNVKRNKVAERLRPVIEYYKESRNPNEEFGDFCNRVGVENLREIAAPVPA